MDLRAIKVENDVWWSAGDTLEEILQGRLLATRRGGTWRCPSGGQPPGFVMEGYERLPLWPKVAEPEPWPEEERWIQWTRRRQQAA